MNIFQPGEDIEAAKINENFAEVDAKQFVLSEAMTAGDFVRLIDDNGTPKIASIFESLTASVGTQVALPGSMSSMSACYDPINKVIVVLYVSTYVYSYCGKFDSAGVITWNSCSALSTVSGGLNPKVVYDSLNQKIVAMYYKNNSAYTTIGILKYNPSYNSVTIQSEQSIGSIYDIQLLEYKVGRFILVYCTSSDILIRTVTVSGDTLTLNTVYSKTPANSPSYVCAAYNNNGKIYIGSYQNDYSYYYPAIVQSASISNDVITFDNNPLSYSSQTAPRKYKEICFAGNVVVMFWVYNNVLKHILVTDTSGTLAFSGAEVTDISGNSALEIKKNNSALEVCYQDTSGSDSYFRRATFTQGTVSWNTAVKIYDNTSFPIQVYVPHLHKILFLNSSYSVLYQEAGKFPTKIDDTCGVLQASGSAGDSKSVIMNYRTSKAHSGHTIGANAYIDPTTGLLTETESDYPVGLFTSPTDLLYFRTAGSKKKYVGKYFNSGANSSGQPAYVDIVIPLGYRASKVTAIVDVNLASATISETNKFEGTADEIYFWVEGLHLGYSLTEPSTKALTTDYFKYYHPASVNDYVGFKVQAVDDTSITLRFDYYSEGSGSYAYANCIAFFIIE